MSAATNRRASTAVPLQVSRQAEVIKSIKFRICRGSFNQTQSNAKTRNEAASATGLLRELDELDRQAESLVGGDRGAHRVGERARRRVLEGDSGGAVAGHLG